MHMMQLRQDYDKFVQRRTEILVIGPEGPGKFQQEWSKNSFPFIGIPDTHHEVANLYGQRVKLLKLGRMPAMMIIDKDGQIRYSHFGNGMSDIPINQLILNILDDLYTKVPDESAKP
jgi:peroxiredoxin